MKCGTLVADTHAPTVYLTCLRRRQDALWTRPKGTALIADSAGDQAQSESLLSCMTTNINFKLHNDVVKAMLRQTVREVYAPREVYRRFLWVIENVHPRQLKGRPPAETRAQQWFLAKFGAVTLLRVLYRAGVQAPFRREFWRFVRDLFRFKGRGVIDSVLEELLLVTPNAYHLITWGSTLLSDGVGAQTEVRAAALLALPEPVQAGTQAQTSA